MIQREHFEAVALVRWWAGEAARRGIDSRLLIHIPNEGKRPVWVGRKLKDAGLRTGTPDYFLAIPVKSEIAEWYGLWIELKAAKGRATDSQNEMLSILSSNGYAVAICYGFDDARELILKYLKG